MNQEPKVSIIMPTFDRADLISRAIASVIRQTYKNWELIIVDDGSTDPTDVTVAAWQLMDFRIKYIRLEQNSGNPSIPRNAGIDASTGELITYLDSDDEYLPDKLAGSVKALVENPGIAMVNTGRERHGFHADPEIWFGCPIDIDSAMHWKKAFDLIPEKFGTGDNGTNWNQGHWFEEDQDLFGKIVSRVGPIMDLQFIGVIIHINHKSKVINRQVSHK